LTIPLDLKIQSFFFAGFFPPIRWIELQIPAKNSFGRDLENFSLDFQNSGIEFCVGSGDRRGQCIQLLQEVLDNQF